MLFRIFGTITLGTIGVDGFFLISGYLITRSVEESRSFKEYIVKRVLRIYEVDPPVRTTGSWFLIGSATGPIS